MINIMLGDGTVMKGLPNLLDFTEEKKHLGIAWIASVTKVNDIIAIL